MQSLFGMALWWVIPWARADKAKRNSSAIPENGTCGEQGGSDSDSDSEEYRSISYPQDSAFAENWLHP